MAEMRRKADLANRGLDVVTRGRPRRGSPDQHGNPAVFALEIVATTIATG